MSNKRQFELKFDGRFAEGQVLPVENFFDLSPFYLHSFGHSGRNFSFINPLKLTPDCDEAKRLYCLEYAALGIDVFAYTRDQLDLELREHIAFLWDSYAMADDAELTESALQLKNKLLNTLNAITDVA
jgi:hypothetical protein